jgi:NAD-dependent DNA ligase
MQHFLEKASAMYYSGHPIISDEEFDALAKLYNYDTVGHTVTDGIPHLYRMYSLQKVFHLDDIPTPNAAYVRTPKLDGAAVSLQYINGHLAQALTRGDGNLGRDITLKLEELVPPTISALDKVQITGEVVAPDTIPNARNFAAGSLNLKDPSEFRSRAKDLRFVAYDIQGAHVEFETLTAAMDSLAQEGFSVVTHFDATGYPTDGEVFRINNYNSFYKMGYTAHHPRGAFALKEKKDGVITELLDVEWQVGKSGVVSPVAILRPVEVGDALVSRATLHNIEYIRSLNLEIGCSVEVIRSGEIIPRIVRRVDVEKNSS